MKIGIIGAGKVGCALAFALKEKGYAISGVYSKSAASASYLTDTLNLTLPNDIIETVINSEVIFITTLDKAIRDISEIVVNKVSNIELLKKTFFHCSGALNSDEIQILRQYGAYTGSFHPIQTFADKANGWIALNNIYFGFEGSEEAKVIAGEIAKAFDSKLLILDKNSKMLYHTAACILSNYLVTLSFLAESLFEKIGFDPKVGLKAFMPLVEKSVNNIKEKGSVDALTGPISRGDCAIIEQQLKALEENSPELLEVYKALGSKTVEVVMKRGNIESDIINKLNQLFEQT